MARPDRPAHEDDVRDVDFVVGEVDEGPDEDLPQPDDARSRRRPIELAIGALVLLVAILIVRANLDGSNAPQAAPTTSAPRSSIAPVPTPTGPVTAPPLVENGIIPPAEATGVVAAPKHVPTRHGHNPRTCPGHRCTATTDLPTRVTAAIHDSFPESNVEEAITVRLRGGRHVLWYREVEVRVGTEQLLLRIEAPARGQLNRAGYRRADNDITTYYAGRLGPWYVRVEVVDLLGGKPQLEPVRRLAGDPRILRT